MKTCQAWGLWAESLLRQTVLAAGECVLEGAAGTAGNGAREHGGARRHPGAGAVWSGALVLVALVLAAAVAFADPLNEDPAQLAVRVGGSSTLAADDLSAGTDASGAGAEAPEAEVTAGEDAEAEAGELSDPSSVTEKPYSTPTPVDSPDNTVNTHQLPDSSFLYDTSLVDLAGADDYYDGQTVQIVGEVIGDIIKEGFDDGHVWVTLTSTSPEHDETVTVFMTASQAAIIDTLGGYGRTGTILQVRGVYHLACSDHQGLSDIHVENVNVVEPGSRDPDVFAWRDFMPGVAGLLFAGALLLVFHLLRQRLR